MKCQSCGSKRLVTLWMKCNDLASVTFKGREYDGNIPDDLGIQGGDDPSFTHCLNCGQIQGTWPLPKSYLEKKGQLHEPDSFDEDDEDEDYSQPLPKLSWAERRARADERSANQPSEN